MFKFAHKGGLQYRTFNNRCVKATLTDTELDAHKAIMSILKKTNLFGSSDVEDDATLHMAMTLTDYNIMKHSYTGKAQVNVEDGDVFDEEHGQLLARRRCLSSYHKDFDNIIKHALTRARTVVVAIEHYCIKHGIDTSSVPSASEIYQKVYESGNHAGKK